MDEPENIHDHSQAKSEVAQHKARDEHGHFVHADTHPSSEPPPPVFHPPVMENPVHVAETKDDKTLVDVHVGNPLHKITELLQEIKQQKAFAFTIKGSLGIAGIALVVTTFGIFGGTRAFCSKGVQSHKGTLYTLQVSEEKVSSVPLIDMLKNLFMKDTGNSEKRVTLIQSDSTILHLVNVNQKVADQYSESKVIATGEYDACTQTLTVKDPSAIEDAP